MSHKTESARTKELTSTTNTCPVCGSANISIFLEMLQVPVYCNVLWPTRDEAIHAPRGDLRLGFCKVCGHIYNFAFNSDDVNYAQDYENSLEFSPRFQKYARSLASQLITRHNLYDKDIIEIGSGSGYFLDLLCEMGGNRGVGFDPSSAHRRFPTPDSSRVTFVQDYYSERHATYKADFICCRHVLEHMQFPLEFLNKLRHAIGPRRSTPVFFEVPNALFTFSDLGIWDLIYEHPSYFSLSSLAAAFTQSGFKLDGLTETFEGQFLCIEALAVKGSEASRKSYLDDLDSLTCHVAEFAAKYHSKVEYWRSELDTIFRGGKRAVVWGVGSKGVTFLNVLQLQDRIEYVVDINPHKRGKHVPGTGQKIVAPAILREYRPDIVIVMNPMYGEEIRQLLETMQSSAETVIA